MKPPIDRTRYSKFYQRVIRSTEDLYGLSDLSILYIPEHIISHADFGVYQQDFDDHFKPSGQLADLGAKYSVPWTALEGLITVQVVALKFHYAVRGGKFTYIIELLEQNANGELVAINDSNFIYNGGAFVKLSTNDRDTAVALYYSMVKVDRGDGNGFGSLRDLTKPLSDPSATIYAWQTQVFLLLDETRKWIGGAKQDYYLTLTPIAVEDPFKQEKYPENEIWHHSTAISVSRIVPADQSTILLELVSTASSGPSRLVNRAMDYGNLCPPRCK